VRKRLSIVLAGATLVVGLLASVGSAGTAAPNASRAHGGYLARGGYLSARGFSAHLGQSAAAARWVAAHRYTGKDSEAAGGRFAVVGSSWQGIAQSNLTPPDPNGAIGPNSYVEIVNQKMAIYSRAGTLISSGNLTNFGTGSLSDPMVLWDPHTQRFYFNVWDTNSASMVIGFSKSSNPATVTTTDWCSYKDTFGYPSTSFPDYPKLGQTKDFLLIGVNFYPTSSSLTSTQSDLLWAAKPQGTGTITTCPASPTHGKISNVLNQDGTQAFTLVPAIQTDPSSTGYMVATADIECSSNPCGNTGNFLTLFKITNNAGTPQVTLVKTITVTTYMVPPSAPQSGTANKLDTLDGRLTHAVSGFDPRVNATTIWTVDTIAGGAGSIVKWYEIKAGGAIAQQGKVTSSTYSFLNGSISSDRACTATSCAFGDSMVLGYTRTSSSSFPTILMVSKVGAGAQGGATLIHSSTTFDKNFSCSPCRWGDYGGATPDPAAPQTGAHGEVWLTNQFTTGGSAFASGDATWNWEAKVQ
jgi:hypothetical protein